MPENNPFPYTVWSGPRSDRVCETLVEAKKHAAWLHFTFGFTTWWYKRVSITRRSDGEIIPFDDYEFKNGDSRKVS
jgi:hypothetical protein